MELSWKKLEIQIEREGRSAGKKKGRMKKLLWTTDRGTEKVKERGTEKAIKTGAEGKRRREKIGRVETVKRKLKNIGERAVPILKRV